STQPVRAGTVGRTRGGAHNAGGSTAHAGARRIVPRRQRRRAGDSRDLLDAGAGRGGLSDGCAAPRLRVPVPDRRGVAPGPARGVRGPRETDGGAATADDARGARRPARVWLWSAPAGLRR